MNSKEYKSWAIFVSILFVISCSCTIIGYVNKDKPRENNGPKRNETEIDYNITYKYFLEGVEVNEMPINPKKEETNETNETEEDLLYKFDGYKCDNNVTGNFNTQKWKFIPDKNDKSTCELYFNKSKYEVKLTVIKGTPDENNNYYVDRFKDGEFKIIPNDGYKFLESQCSNDKVASYDASTKILKISAISSDVTCKVTFTQKKLSFELTIKNGLSGGESTGGKIKTEQLYGESLAYLIQPQDGYEFKDGHLKCSNNQVAEYSKNNFSIAELTSDTKCTLEFTKATVKKYKITLTNTEKVKDKFEITKGDDVIEVNEGETGTIEIKSLDENIMPKLNCSQLAERTPSGGNGYTFVWMGVTKNISCEIGQEAKTE